MDCDRRRTNHQREKGENPYRSWVLWHGIIDGAPKPRVGDYDDIKDWQRDYNEWYRNKRGNCPNFCGHS